MATTDNNMQGTLCFSFSRFLFGKWHTLSYNLPSGASTVDVAMWLFCRSVRMDGR